MRLFFQILVRSALVVGASGFASAQEQPQALVYQQKAYLKASNTGARDYFGVAVAMDGDTMVVGAPFESSLSAEDPDDDSRNESGAAYVFEREEGKWQQRAMLKPPGDGLDFRFGRGVAIEGDTIAIGAPLEGSEGEEAGAVFVYVRGEDGWAQQGYLKAENPGRHDYFGWSVALSGDTLVAGSLLEDGGSRPTGMVYNDNSPDSGAAYVFVRAGDEWEQQAYLKASNVSDGDQFGHAVAIDGDTIAVGAHGESSVSVEINGSGADETAPDAGAAYIFVREGGVWSQQAYLKPSTNSERDKFGYSVALSGDRLAVGATFANDSTGATFVFERAEGRWQQQAFFLPPNPECYRFGTQVSLEGDKLVTSAVLDSSSATGVDADWSNTGLFAAGAVYVYGLDQDSREWELESYIKASNTDESDNFGRSFGLSGGTLAIGAHGEDSAATGIDGDENDNSARDSGAVYVFELVPAQPLQVTSIRLMPGMDVLLTAPYVRQRRVGIEFSPDLSPGSWVELGNFRSIDGVNVFLDQDISRSDREAGFYRAFLR